MLVSPPYFIHAYIFIFSLMNGSYTQCGALRVLPPIALLRWLFLFLLTCSFCDPDAPRNIFVLNHRILDSLCHLLIAVHLLVACMY
jgi:hypothetical protein